MAHIDIWRHSFDVHQHRETASATHLISSSRDALTPVLMISLVFDLGYPGAPAARLVTASQYVIEASLEVVSDLIRKSQKNRFGIDLSHLDIDNRRELQT